MRQSLCIESWVPDFLNLSISRVWAIEIRDDGLRVESEVPVPVMYRGREIHTEGFRLDLLVEGVVVVELKSVEKVLPVHKKQLLTYLRLADKRLGLLINFNEELLVNGITRISNGL